MDNDSEQLSVLTRRSSSSQMSSGGTRVGMSQHGSGSMSGQPLTIQRNAILFDGKIEEMFFSVKYPDLNLETRVDSEENKAYDDHMARPDSSLFIVFARSKLIALIYNNITLDADGLWAEFRQLCIDEGICNVAWLDKHEKFSHRKHLKDAGANAVTKLLVAKFKDSANENRRELIQLWFNIWRYRLRDYIHNSLWHFYADHVESDGNLYPSFKDCHNADILRTYDMYDPCFQWDYIIGQKQIILGMNGDVVCDESGTLQVQGWKAPEDPRFIGHPNYFIAPFKFLAWWMKSVRECLESLESILSAKHLTFQMNGDDHIMEVGRFSLDSLYDPAFEDHSLFRNTAAHDLDYLRRVLFHLRLLFSQQRTALLECEAKFLGELYDLDWLIKNVRDFRHRAEIHQFFAFFKGLGTNGDFSSKCFLLGDGKSLRKEDVRFEQTRLPPGTRKMFPFSLLGSLLPTMRRYLLKSDSLICQPYI
jgi:hypothetical protein